MFPITRIQIDYIINAVDHTVIRKIQFWIKYNKREKSYVQLQRRTKCVFYMFPICSRKVDFDEDTFNDIGFKMIQFWIKYFHK